MTIARLLIATLCCLTLTAAALPTPKILRFATGAEPEFLDPTLNTENTGSQILLGLFEGLVVPDPVTLAPRPGVAEHWTISPDGRTYTFTLRKNAVWSDGHLVTAQHFVDGWRRAVDPATASGQASRLYYIVNGRNINEGKQTDLTTLGITATNDHTLVVTLVNPFPPFLELATYATFAPIRLDVVARHGTQWTKPEHMVSNGAFRLARWEPQQGIVLTKSPNYWNAANVQLTHVIYYPIEDTGTAVKMFQVGHLDYVYGIPPTQLDNVRALPAFHTAPMFSSNFLHVNVKHAPVNDVRVRRALAMAIDRDILCTQFMRGMCLPAHRGIIPLGIDGFTYPAPIPYDPAAARALLKAAGYADPATMPPIQLIYNTNETHKIMTEVVQQMWKENLGITVTIQNMEWKALLKQLDQRQYTMSRFGGVGEYLYPTTYLETYLSGAPGNAPQYSNATYDALWDQAGSEADPAKQMALYSAMAQMLLDDMPTIPINSTVRTYLINPRFGNLVPNPLQIHPPQFITVNPTTTH